MPPTDRVIEGPSGPIGIRDFGGQGRPTLLLHGGLGSVADWDLIAPRLTSCRAIALDLRGYGRSPGRFSFDGIAADAELVISRLNMDAPLVCGYSLGGHAALHLAATRSGVASRVVTLDGPSWLVAPPVGPEVEGIPGVPEAHAQDIRDLFSHAPGGTTVLLCNAFRGTKASWILGLREELADHLATARPDIDVHWMRAGHDLNVSHAPEVAKFLTALAI